MLAQRGLDLAQLHPEAADLHLVVGPAQELQISRGEQAHQVAGAVQAAAGPGTPGIGDEPLGGQIGAARVAARQARAADVQLARDPWRDEPQPRIQDAGPEVAHRPADRHLSGRQGGGREPGGQLRAGRDDRALGGAVGVDELRPPVPLGVPGGQPLGQRPLAAEDHQPQPRGQARGLRLKAHHQLVPEGGGQVEHRDLRRLAGTDELGRRAQHGVVAQHQRGAARQRGIDLLGAGVEADRGELEHAVTGPEAVLVAEGLHVVRQPAVTDHHSLGPAGRAGGVDQVGQVLGIDGRLSGLAPAPRRDLRRVGVEPDGRGHRRRQARQAGQRALAGDQDRGRRVRAGCTRGAPPDRRDRAARRRPPP